MKRPILALLVFVLAARLLALPFPPLTDTTEGRYASIAREMADTGDWVTPRLWHKGEHVAFLGKPPLHFWLAAVSVRLFGPNEFAVRFPAWLCAAGLIVLMHRVLRRFHGRRLADWACFLTAASAGYALLSGFSGVDMTLTFGVSGALLANYAFLREQDDRKRNVWSVLVFVFLAWSFMVKGPVGLLAFGMPVFLWTLWHHQWRAMSRHWWALGVVLFLALTVPWFVMCENANPGSTRYFFWNENVLRFITPGYGDRYGHGHAQFRGMSVLMTLGVLGPGSLLALWAFAFRRRSVRLRALLASRRWSYFLIPPVAWALFWCLGRQYLATYFVPLVPMGAVWLAALIRHIPLSPRLMPRFAAAWTAVLVIACFAAAPFLESNSTRVAPSLAAKLGDRAEGGRLVWLHLVPYSACFYMPGSACTIPMERDWSNAADIAPDAARDVFVARRKSFDRMPEGIKARIGAQARGAGWIVFRLKAEGGPGSGAEPRARGRAASGSASGRLFAIIAVGGGTLNVNGAVCEHANRVY